MKSPYDSELLLKALSTHTSPRVEETSAKVSETVLTNWGVGVGWRSWQEVEDCKWQSEWMEEILEILSVNTVNVYVADGDLFFFHFGSSEE